MPLMIFALQDSSRFDISSNIQKRPKKKSFPFSDTCLGECLKAGNINNIQLVSSDSLFSSPINPNKMT